MDSMKDISSMLDRVTLVTEDTRMPPSGPSAEIPPASRPRAASAPKGPRLLADLRQMILTGRLAPGEVLVEPRLAEQFGLSKTPVREALHILAAEGLVTVLPKKGYLVQTMAAQDLSEVLDLRMLLEPHAAAEAARHATAGTVSALRSALDRQGELTGGDALDAMGAARGFHLAVAEEARNARLVTAIERVLDDMARAHHVLPGLQAQMAHPHELAEHEAILEAIAAGDGPAAGQAMRKHLRSVREAVLEHLQRTSTLWSGPGVTGS